MYAKSPMVFSSAVTRQKGSQEPAGPSQQGNGPAIIAQREQKGRRRHEGHQEKGGEMRDEIVEVVGGVYRKVENRHARAGQALGKNGQISEMETVASADQQQAGRTAHEHARQFIQPVVVEGVFQEEAHAEYEGESAHAVQQLAADQDFPLFAASGAQHAGNPGWPGNAFGQDRNRRRPQRVGSRLLHARFLFIRFLLTCLILAGIILVHIHSARFVVTGSCFAGAVLLRILLVRVFRCRSFPAGYPLRRLIRFLELPPDDFLEVLYTTRKRQVRPDEEKEQQ